MERRIIVDTPREENNTCIYLVYEANGAHACFPRRYRLWPRPEKVRGRGLKEDCLWLETRDSARMGFSSRVLSLNRIREGTWKV